MNPLLTRTLKAVAGLVVLGIIGSVIAGWWGDYQRTAELNASLPSATSTPSATATGNSASPDKKDTTTTESKSGTKKKPAEKSPADSGKPQADMVVIQIDGLNFRKDPDGGSTPIRGLAKGERLILLQERDGWYQVRASDGTEGWISAAKGYTTIENR